MGTTANERRLIATSVALAAGLTLAACGAPPRDAVVDSTIAVGAAPSTAAPTGAGRRPVVTTEAPVPLTMNTVLPRPTVATKAPAATTPRTSTPASSAASSTTSAPRSSTSTSSSSPARSSTTSSATASSTVAPDAGAPAASPDGTDFLDSDGAYELTISPTWQDRSALAVQGVEFWVVGKADQGFMPNVSVQTRSSGGRTLEEFVQSDTGDALGLHIVSAEIRTGSRGNPLAVVEVTGIPSTSSLKVPLHMLMVVDIKGDTAVVAAFGTTADTYDALIGTVQPYLMSLRAL